ncbi:MAG: acyl-CoA dehydrogenase family protein, partial [Vicinamibacterales bacterium]
MTGVVEHALDEYRDHVRQWTAQHLSLRSQDSGRHALGDLAHDDVEAAKRIQHKIFNAGFIGITLPTEYGGAGLTAAHERIWYEESSKYAVPIPRGVATLVTLGIILPTVL